MTEYLGYTAKFAFFILLLASAIAVVLYLSSLFKRKFGEAAASKIDLYAKAIGAFAATVGLFVAITGVAVPPWRDG